MTFLNETNQRLPTSDEINGFHKYHPRSKEAYDIYDDKICKFIIEHNEIMVISGKGYLYRDGYYRMDDSGALLKHLIKQCMKQEVITISRIDRVYKLILTEYELQTDYEQVNQYPKHWVNFQNGMVDILTDEIHHHDPKYKSVNQIPHNYVPNLNIETSVFYKFIQSRIPDIENQQMLFEFMGYCITPDIIFQKFMLFWGLGDAGKTVIINFIRNMIGIDNISSISLQELGSRFTTSYLLHKQLNACGDIPSTALKDTSIIKQLTGEDTIKAEYKGGACFFFRNRAKFLFSCNELPLILDEKSNGFYRRLLIIHFETNGEYIPDLYEKLADEKEIETVISYVVRGAKTAIKRGKIFESGASLGAVSRLRRDSDTVSAFLEDWTEQRQGGRIRRPDLYGYYEEFCKEEQRTPLGKSGFFRNLRTKGIKETKVQGIMYFCGIDVSFRKTESSVLDN